MQSVSWAQMLHQRSSFLAFLLDWQVDIGNQFANIYCCILPYPYFLIKLTFVFVYIAMSVSQEKHFVFYICFTFFS